MSRIKQDVIAIDRKPPAAKPVRNRWKALDALADDADVLVDRREDLGKRNHLVWRHQAALENGKLIDAEWVDVDEVELNADEKTLLADCEDALALLDGAENYDDDGELKREIISGRLASLVGGFPNGAPGEPEVYTRMLLEHVAAICDLSLPALDAACREIAETKKFLPAIAEVLEVVREQNAAWCQRISAVKGLAPMAGRIAARIAEIEPQWRSLAAARDVRQAEHGLNFAGQLHSKAAAEAVQAQQRSAIAAEAAAKALAWVTECEGLINERAQRLAEATVRLASEHAEQHQ